MPRIYTNTGPRPFVDVPKLDLLTLLFGENRETLPGVRLSIDKTAPDSEHSVAQDDTVLHVEAANPSNTINKKELRDLVQRIAHGLRHHYGVGANGPDKDVVTVISYGQPMVPAAFYGVIAAGGVYSAASPSSTVSELA